MRDKLEEVESEIAEIIVGRENDATKIESLINLFHSISTNYIPKEKVKKIITQFEDANKTRNSKMLQLIIRLLNSLLSKKKE